MAFIRRVRTGSCVTAVQIAEYVSGRRQRIVAHLGSAHSEVELGLLMARAQGMLDDAAQGASAGMTITIFPGGCSDNVSARNARAAAGAPTPAKPRPWVRASWSAKSRPCTSATRRGTTNLGRPLRGLGDSAAGATSPDELIRSR